DIKKRNNPSFVYRTLASIFIPAFLRLIPEEHQKDYIITLRRHYNAYWSGLCDMFHELPDFPCDVFDLYVTIDLIKDMRDANEIRKSRFVKVSGENKDNFICLQDRHETRLQFLMTLNKFAIPSSLIPLIDSIILSFETDLGNAVDLHFSEFISHQGSLVEDINDFELIQSGQYYSICTFKLDEAYKVRDFAIILNKRVLVKLNEFLDPHNINRIQERILPATSGMKNSTTVDPTLSNSSEVGREMEIVEAFRRNFRLSLLEPIKVKIGEGFMSSIGKAADNFLGRLVLLGFIATAIDVVGALAILQNQERLGLNFETATLVIAVIAILTVLLTLVWIGIAGFREKIRERARTIKIKEKINSIDEF
ncbi:MAG: hypothetical protein ACFFBD_26540, partial [Candidatus Hodarchaeota archaeon]